MISLGSVSGRILAIYERFYSAREEDRFVSLIKIFEDLSSIIEESDLGVGLEMDYLCLGEIIRSYFLDTIRYKEYHFDPKNPVDFSIDEDAKKAANLLQKFGVEQIQDLDQLSAEWTQLVHDCIRTHKSKVAAYTVKWILRYKPISVFDVSNSGTTDDKERPLPDIPILSPLLANINEEFAYLCALTALGIDGRRIPKEKQDELIYCFRFRNFDEASYFMILTEDYLCAPSEN